MKLGSVTKLEKRKDTRSKKIDDDFMPEIVTSLSIFQFMANMQQSGSRVPDAYPVKRIFSLIVIFYIPKTENN